MDRAFAKLAIDPLYRDKILFVTGTDEYGQKEPGSNSFTGANLVAAPENVLTLTGSSGVAPGHGTSFSAPFVAGLASLLWTMDPSLTGPEVTSFILRGAVQSRRDPQTGDLQVPNDIGLPGVYQLDAYGSLTLLARERTGVPLCGNRLWAQNNDVFVERAGGPQSIFNPGVATAFLNPYHGGRRIDLFVDGTGEQSLVLANGAWVPADPANLPAGNPSGTWNSLNGATHDGDSSTSAQSVAVPGGRQFEVRIGTIFSVGRSLGTLTVPLLPRTGSECIRQVADMTTATISCPTHAPTRPE